MFWSFFSEHGCTCLLQFYGSGECHVQYLQYESWWKWNGLMVPVKDSLQQLAVQHGGMM